MQMTQLVRKLSQNDVKLIGRDSFLMTMALYVFFLAMILRFLLPWGSDYLAENGILPNESFDVALADMYPAVIAFFALFLGALLMGIVFGFMLLDEKDDNTLMAMMVTPVSLDQYMLYRIGIPTVLGFFGVLATLLIIGQISLPFWQLTLIALGASFIAPAGTLFFATFAENKVQGFALTKFVGMAGIPIFIAWFLDAPLQYIFGVFPPFWTVKAYWMAIEGDSLWIVVLLVGIVLQIGMVWLLRQRFITVMRKRTT
ncbi:MAG: hypothetical protein AAFV98_05045 [Chloroflexota bacterium]